MCMRCPPRARLLSNHSPPLPACHACHACHARLPAPLAGASGFNRLARLARGSVLVTLQDDQLPPDSCAWLRDTLGAMRAHPRLGLLGLRRSEACFDVRCAPRRRCCRAPRAMRACNQSVCMCSSKP